MTLTNDGSLTTPTAYAFTGSGAPAGYLFVSGADLCTADVNSGDLTPTLKDAFGNDATRGADTVITPASNSTGSAKAFKTTGGTTQTTFTITAGTSTVSFKYYDEKAGSWSITLTNDGSLTNPSAYSFTIDPAAAAALAYQVQPTDVTAGVAISPAVKVKVTDAFGNTVTGDTSNVTVALTTAGGATLSGTKTRAASTGVATFSDLSVDKTGSYTLTATDGSLTSAQSTSFSVNPAAAASLSLAATTTTPTAGTGDTVTITALDAYGNTATSYTGDHDLTFGGAATIGSFHPTVTDKSSVPTNFGTATTITFANGVATATMKLYKAESTSISVTDGTHTNGAGLGVTVAPASAASLSLAAQTTTP